MPAPSHGSSAPQSAPASPSTSCRILIHPTSSPPPSHLQAIQDPLGKASRVQAPITQPKPTHSFELVVL
ncbi:hypothetical protein CLOM_g20648 [Closterium sp. NIES-68]|nr:hypothetical protein CLOM_g20648 [Closterium sp. NIES-68]